MWDISLDSSSVPVYCHVTQVAGKSNTHGTSVKLHLTLHGLLQTMFWLSVHIQIMFLHLRRSEDQPTNISSLSKDVLTFMVRISNWSLQRLKYESTHTHTHTLSLKAATFPSSLDYLTKPWALLPALVSGFWKQEVTERFLSFSAARLNIHSLYFLSFFQVLPLLFQ